MTAFFVGLGFETDGRMVLKSEFVDTVCGIPDLAGVAASLAGAEREELL